jgi:DNA invertase Pin-like site-specific DNA recombinase
LRALEFVREGDVLIVTKLDRLARSVRDLLDIVDHIEAKKANLKILTSDLDTTQPKGRLLLQMLSAVAEFERNLMLERQREGIAKAKAAGKPTVRARKAEIEALLRSGVGPAEASRRLGIARSSIYRIATIIGTNDCRIA